MTRRKPQVLVAGESVGDALAVADHLQRWGCEVLFSTTLAEASRLLRQRACQLVLSETRLADGSAYPLITLVAGSPASLFLFHPVRDGVWWLPAVRRGRYCWGSPALRPAEFVQELNQILKEISEETALPASMVRAAAAADVPDSVFTFSRQEISQTEPKKLQRSAAPAKKKLGKSA